MSASTVTSEGDMASAAAPFSYAQAARGKTAASTTSSNPKSDTSSWADDTAELIMPNGDRENGTGTMTPRSKIADEIPTSPNPPSMVIKEDVTKATAADLALPSSAQASQDDTRSDSKPSSEGTWESKSQTSNTATTPQSAGEERLRSSESGKEKHQGKLQDVALDSSVKSFEKALKDAPLPTVNFWQQRAQEAKDKQIKAQSSSKSVAPATSAQPISTNSANAPPTDTAKLPPKQQQPANLDISTDSRSSDDTKEPSSAVTQGTRPSRPYKSEGEISRVAPLPPPVGDAVSWPTPVNAQDDDRRKAQEKGDKLEKEKGSSVPSKPHGKNEWKHVPYTPSVKFNTPIPQRGGRGGRGGARGGRGGAPGERSSTFPHTHASSEQSRNPRQNDKVEDSNERSSSLPETPTQTNDAVQEIDRSTMKASARLPSKDSESGAVAEASSSPKETLIRAQTWSSQTGNHSTQERTAQREPTPWVSRTNADRRDAKTKAESNDAYPFSNRKKSSATYGDAPFESGSGPRTKRRSSQVMNRNETSNIEIRDRRRTGLDNDAVGEMPEFSMPKPESQAQPQESTREAWSQPPPRERGEGRPERGRGFKNGRGGHTHGPPYSTSAHNPGIHLPPIQTSNHTRGNQSFHSQQYSQSGPFSSNSRNIRNGPRSASIPSDTTFGRFTSGYPNGYQYAYAPYANGMYDYTGLAPISASQYSPFVEHTMLMSEISTQLTYYFSLENMLKDMFLRKFMDSQGFVPLALIANFKRMRELTHDLELIKLVCLQLEGFDLVVGADGKDRLRKRDDWEKWVLSMDERDSSAQNDGVVHPEPSRTAYGPVLDQTVAQSAVSPDFTMAGHENQQQPFSGAAASFTPLPLSPPVNGYHGGSPFTHGSENEPQKVENVERLDSTTSPSHTKSGLRPQEEQDSHHDDQTQFLRIATRPLKRDSHSAGATTESRRVHSGGYPNGTGTGEPHSSDVEHLSGPFARADDFSPGEHSQYMSEGRRSLPARPTATSSPSSDSAQCIWIKENEIEKFLPLPQNADYMTYEELHTRALKQRQHAAHGHTPYDLFVLYNFWSHFLIRNFNSNMYEEFYRLAHDDAITNSSEAGVESLIRYYQEALTGQIPMRDRVAHDYVALAEQARTSQNRMAFESLRSAWRNGATNMKNRKKISDFVESELRAELDR